MPAGGVLPIEMHQFIERAEHDLKSCFLCFGNGGTKECREQRRVLLANQRFIDEWGSHRCCSGYRHRRGRRIGEAQVSLNMLLDSIPLLDIFSAALTPFPINFTIVPQPHRPRRRLCPADAGDTSKRANHRLALISPRS